MFVHFIVTLLWHEDFHPFIPTILACWHDHKGKNHPSLVISRNYSQLCIFCSSSLWGWGEFLLHNVAVNADPSETQVSYERLNKFQQLLIFFFVGHIYFDLSPFVTNWISGLSLLEEIWYALVRGNLFIGYLQVNCPMDFLLTFLPYGFHYAWEKYIQGFCGKTWSRDTTWKTMHRWEDNIRVNLKTAGWDGMDWTHVAVNSTMPLWPW